MKPQNTQVLSITTCRHRTRTGRRCRFPVSENSALCFRHATRLDAKLVDADLSAAFGNEPLDFRSAVQINDFLAKLSGLLTQNRISSRRAAVLAYIANLELRTLLPSTTNSILTTKSPESFSVRPTHPTASRLSTTAMHFQKARLSFSLVDAQGMIQ
jgi:hypothetical protein